MLLGESASPRTDQEMLFAMAVLLIGAIVHAALFGQVALLVANLNRAATRFQDKLDGVSEHTKNLALDADLCHRIQEYVEFEWQLNRCLDRNAFIATLSPALQDEICVVVTGDMVSGPRAVPAPPCERHWNGRLESFCLLCGTTQSSPR